MARKAREVYGDHLDRTLLYGSRARGDNHAESDLDVLLVVSADSYDPRGRIDDQLLTFFLVEKWHEPMWGLLSVRSASVEQVETWDTTFFRNVRADAIPVQ